MSSLSEALSADVGIDIDRHPEFCPTDLLMDLDRVSHTVLGTHQLWLTHISVSSAWVPIIAIKAKVVE
ncbi:MAG: hypothetical protein NTY64_18725 [Deltaproteobacteria bacterium]|nr:hypothetical protein [Deltaproteobacteria bacterium]